MRMNKDCCFGLVLLCAAAGIAPAAAAAANALSIKASQPLGNVTLRSRAPAAVSPDEAARSILLVEALRAEDDAWHLASGISPSSFTRALARSIEAGDGAGRLATQIAGIDPADLLEAEGVSDARPFSVTRSRVDGLEVELALGAPETVLALATAGTDLDHAPWYAQLEDGAAAGERLVGLARRDAGGPWRMRALIGFADPIRPGIREAMAMARPGMWAKIDSPHWLCQMAPPVR